MLFIGIITISDLLSIGIYKVANELGFNIPGNYSIIEYDNIEVTSVLSPPLNTIYQPRKKICFEPHIILRGSVRNIN